MDMIDSFLKDYDEQMERFLSLCGEKDNNFLSTAQSDNIVNECARLIIISMILGLRAVTISLIGIIETKKIVKETADFISWVKSDFETIDSWMKDFIDNIPDSEIKQIVSDIWHEEEGQFDKDRFD